MKHFLAMVVLLSGASLLLAEDGGQVPFRVGEKLTYQIYWGPLVAGRAEMEVVRIEQVDGHDCYRIRAEARTTGLADVLFKVRSTTESWLDVKELCTRQYRQDRTEGKSVRRDEGSFNYERQQHTVTNLVTGQSKVYPLTAPTVDVVAALYAMRARKLLVNELQQVLVNDGRTNHVVSVTPDQRRTMWLRPVGDITALRLEPKPTLTIVSANKGRMWFWVSDDERRLPLLVASNLKLGTAKLVLDKIESPEPAANKAVSSTPGTAVSRPFDFSAKR